MIKSETDFRSALGRLWDQALQSNLAKVAAIETYLADVHGPAREEAIRSAHGLAGFLGTFRLADAASLASHIEIQIRDGIISMPDLLQAAANLRAQIVAFRP